MNFLEYLNKFESDCKEKALVLKNDGRTDEAHFEKIRASIVEVFKGVLCNFNSKDDIKRVIYNISKSWEVNKEKNKNDIDKEMIENVKLETRDILLGKLDELYAN